MSLAQDDKGQKLARRPAREATVNVVIAVTKGEPARAQARW